MVFDKYYFTEQNWQLNHLFDKTEKYQYLYALTTCYFRIKGFAKTIEYGQQFLDLELQMKEKFYYFKMDHITGLLHAMIVSSKTLKRYFRLSEALLTLIWWSFFPYYIDGGEF